ncbi:MAG: FadR family transcriptional regulator [Deltaproteobacteria bacterium]|nr:FadR family transcriptional regulator [Deltaproteobacteria bacterium]
MSVSAAIAPLSRPARPVDAVVERLRADLLAERFREHLPPERQLAEALGVSRLTLRAALARLEAEGLVRARQGEGVRVLDVREHGTVGLLAHLDLAAKPELARSFLELRRAVAAEAVAAACDRATDADLARLQALADLQAKETDDARYRARDLEFARAVLEAARSFAALLVMNALVPVWHAHPVLADALIADREQSLAGYALTLALLRAKDAAAARDTLRAALEAADERALHALAATSATRKARARAGARLRGAKERPR